MADLPDFLKFTRKRKGDGPNRSPETPKPFGGGMDSNGAWHLAGDGRGANASAQPLSVDPSERPGSGLAEVVKLYAQQQSAALNTDGSGANPNNPAANPNPIAPTTRPRRASAEPTPADASAPGVDYDPAATATRERITDPAGRLENQIGYEQANPAKDKNGWWGTLKESALGFLEQGLGGAAYRGIRNGMDKSEDEKRVQAERVGGWQKQLADIRAKEKESLALEDTRAGIDLKGAQSQAARAKPGIEADRAKAADSKRQQELMQKEIALRLKDPRPFDSQSNDDTDLFNRASAIGVHVPTGAFGDYKNPFTLEIEDPTDPTGTRKTRVVIPRGGGVSAPIMGTDGKPIVTGREEARDERGVPVSKVEQMEHTQDYRAQLLGLSTARLQETMANGLTGRASKLFSTRTAGLFAERGRIETQINGYRTRASKREITPAESERRIGELQKKVDEITGQIDDARSEAEGSMGGASHPRSASSASSPAPSRKYTADEVRERARASGKDPEAAVNAARAKGLLKE